MDVTSGMEGEAGMGKASCEREPGKQKLGQICQLWNALGPAPAH